MPNIPTELPEATLLRHNGPHVQALLKELGELETKQDMMLRLDRSPDFADALCMTFRKEATHGL
jgi:hypothetical protein